MSIVRGFRGNQGEREVMTKQKAEPLLTIHMVGGSQKVKCGLKYVIHISGGPV